jgi:sugar lactone lactonase YvrE
MMTKKLVLSLSLSLTLFLALFAPAPCFSFDRPHFKELNKKGRELAKQKDWPAMRQVLIEIGKEMPALTPIYTLRMASVETHLGNKSAALEWLERYAAMGLTYDVASDDDLKPLLAEPGWKKIAAEMQQNATPVTHADPVCTLPIADLMPEDLTFDDSSGTFIVSSIQHRSLYRLSLPKAANPPAANPPKDAQPVCTLEELRLETPFKRWPTMAVSFDPTRSLVWMTASARSDFTGFPKEDEGKAALLALDSRSGKLVRRFDLESTPPAVLGDMSISSDGTVYVSDSLSGRVFRIAGTPDRAGLDKAKLEMIADDLFSPQTPVLAADGKRLFVPEYPLGIAVIDLTGSDLTGSGMTGSGKITFLSHPENVPVNGIDGMHLIGDSLIAVQNGTEPERVMRFRLNHAQTEIEAAEVVEQSAPTLGEPTHAIVANGYVYVSANVGWDKIDDHGKLKEGATFTAPVLLRFPVKAMAASPAKDASKNTR